MKANVVMLFLLHAEFLTRASSIGMSPVTRVVELLKGLSAKIEQETEQEEKLYQAYVCWANTVIESKTTSNVQAQSHKDSLEQSIGDLEKGRLELTTERANVQKELADLKSDMESAETSRAKEHSDYLSGKEEMFKTMVSLKEATSVLSHSPQSPSEGLLTLNSRLSSGQGFKVIPQGSAELDRAIEIGDRYLSAGDARFLERVFTGTVPEASWKKMTHFQARSTIKHKASLRKKFKERSGKIKDVLKKLLATFSGNLKHSEMKEQNAQDIHDKLMALKEEQQTKSQDTLAKLDVEKGARALSNSDVQEQVEALASQIEADERHISEVSAALDMKKQEWQDRKALRVGEVAAITKGMAVLTSDDARDAFKRSLQSQGYSFLQERRVLSVAWRAFDAAAEAFARQKVVAVSMLRAALQATGDRRLNTIAQRVATEATGHFEVVIKAINQMIGTLSEEEGEDLENKEDCEKDRAQDTRQATLTKREIDEQSTRITKLVDELKQVVAQIEAKDKAIEVIKDELQEAKRIRENDHSDWLASELEDNAAVGLLEQAQKVLESFYKDNGLAFLQSRHLQPQAPFGGESSEAPPPPPPTWEGPYGGKRGESDGIVAILRMIRDDIGKDIGKAKTEEEQAQSEFEAFQAESENQTEALSTEIIKLTETKGQKEEDKSTATEERATTQGEQEAILQKAKAAASGCDFIAANFGVRTKNRQIEMDGLTKAKAILEGAAFSGGPHPKLR